MRYIATGTYYNIQGDSELLSGFPWLSLEQSIFWAMTSYFLSDINAANTALPNKTFLSYTFILRKQFYFIFIDLKIIGHENPDSNLESHCMWTVQELLYKHCCKIKIHMTSVTYFENSTRNLNICYICYCVINFPCLLPYTYPFPVLHVTEWNVEAGV
jgi:hypothetical protein